MSTDSLTDVMPPIDRARLAVNERADVSVARVPIDDTAVTIIDGLFKDPHYVRALALALDFGQPGGAYPGAFASISIHPGDLLDLINDVVDAEPRLRLLDYYPGVTFAVVTYRGDQLSGIQTVPHYDTFCDYAGVIYLNPPGTTSGGTSFWRHRRSGLAGLPDPADPRLASILARAGVSDVEALGRWCLRDGAESHHGYLRESSPYWELLELVPMRFNRMIVYPARLFHTPHVDEGSFGDDRASQRLTQNLYLVRCDRPADR